MGYRSEVSYVFYIRDPEAVSYPTLKLWFDENFPKKTAVNEWEAKIETDGKSWIMVTYQDVKWYDGYDHVLAVGEAVGRFTDTFNANEEGMVAWERARIGEDISDTEHAGSAYCDYRLYVQRSITFD